MYGFIWGNCAVNSKSDPNQPRYLLTEAGVGYRLAMDN